MGNKEIVFKPIKESLAKSLDRWFSGKTILFRFMKYSEFQEEISSHDDSIQFEKILLIPKHNRKLTFSTDQKKGGFRFFAKEGRFRKAFEFESYSIFEDAGVIVLKEKKDLEKSSLLVIAFTSVPMDCIIGWSNSEECFIHSDTYLAMYLS